MGHWGSPLPRGVRFDPMHDPRMTRRLSERGGGGGGGSLPANLCYGHLHLFLTGRYNLLLPVTSGEIGNVTVSNVPIIWAAWSWTGPKVHCQSVKFCGLYTRIYMYIYKKIYVNVYACLTYLHPFSSKKCPTFRISSSFNFLCFLFLRLSILFFYCMGKFLFLFFLCLIIWHSFGRKAGICRAQGEVWANFSRNNNNDNKKLFPWIKAGKKNSQLCNFLAC